MNGRFGGSLVAVRDGLQTGGGLCGQVRECDGKLRLLPREQALAMLQGLDLEMFEEEESDGVTPRGTAKHWHIFHIVARKP